MTLDQLIETIRGQIRDNQEPYTFAKKTEEQPDELEMFVEQALIDYSRWKPIEEKPGTISLQAGTVLYDLPSDFMEMKSFPVNVTFQVLGQQLLLIDVPETAMQIPYTYRAAHSAESVPLKDKVCIVWFAAAQALRAITSDTKKLDSYVSYNLKDVLQVDAKESNRIVTILKENAASLEEKYKERVMYPAEQHASGAAFMTFG
ncbi:hypothetical protein V4V35_23725 [Bacillus infantis]|jgi:hypothetical protein|uniref:phage adaptor protein n=1 Tax=Bacillus infantis TaxID=324767 RepID=UPI002FBD589C